MPDNNATPDVMLMLAEELAGNLAIRRGGTASEHLPAAVEVLAALGVVYVGPQVDEEGYAQPQYTFSAVDDLFFLPSRLICAD